MVILSPLYVVVLILKSSNEFIWFNFTKDIDESAVDSFIIALAQELGLRNIRVNSILPG